MRFPGNTYIFAVFLAGLLGLSFFSLVTRAYDDTGIGAAGEFGAADFVVVTFLRNWDAGDAEVVTTRQFLRGSVISAAKLPDAGPNPYHRFRNWAADRGGTSQLVGFIVEDDMDVFAQWDMLCNVAFHPTGGRFGTAPLGEPYISTVASGTFLHSAMPPAYPSRDQPYQFEGWFCTDNFMPINPSEPVVSNRTFMASWSQSATSAAAHGVFDVDANYDDSDYPSENTPSPPPGGVEYGNIGDEVTPSPSPQPSSSPEPSPSPEPAPDQALPPPDDGDIDEQPPPVVQLPPIALPPPVPSEGWELGLVTNDVPYYEAVMYGTEYSSPEGAVTDMYLPDRRPEPPSIPAFFEDLEPLMLIDLTVPWSVLNLLLTILSVAVACFAVARLIMFMRGDEIFDLDEEDTRTPSEREEEERRRILWPVVACFLSFIAVVMFVTTQDLRSPIVVADSWTVIHVVMLAIGLISLFFANYHVRKPKELIEDNDDD